MDQNASPSSAFRDKSSGQILSQILDHTLLNHLDEPLLGADFTSLLVQQIENEKADLPTVFLVQRILNVFTIEPQAFELEASQTALRHLHEFEVLRVKAVHNCWGTDLEDLTRNPSSDKKGILKKIKRENNFLEQEYALNLLALRKWIFISILEKKPFDKNNCRMNLYTLFPPGELDVNRFLSTKTLAEQCHSLGRYIAPMGKGDLRILAPLKGKGWMEACERLKGYLARSSDMISTSRSILEELESGGPGAYSTSQKLSVLEDTGNGLNK